MNKKIANLYLMKLILTFCLCFLLFFLNNCSVCSCKKVPCPAFYDSDFLGWFPYVNGQQIVFRSNSNSDTLNLHVDKSEPYETTQGCMGASGGCIAHCDIYSFESSGSFNRKLKISMTQPSSIAFYFYEINLLATKMSDTGFVLSSATLTKFYPTLSIANNTWQSVQLITRDTAGKKPEGPYKVYIARGQGIVAYENYPDLAVWIKH